MNIADIYTDLQPLKTERLLLRKVTADDVPDIFAYASDPDVARYVTWNAHKNTEETRDFVDRILARYAHAKLAPWGIVIRQTGRLVGMCDFISWEPKHHRAEVGYVLSKAHWGRGYMTEAVSVLIDFGFKNMDLNRITARCYIPNIGSARVMEKCGLTFEGVQREVTFAKNAFHDLKLYAIIKRDWLAQQQKDTHA